MARLESALGSWELEHVHRWKDRAVEIRSNPVALLGKDTRIVTIGSCFAEELALAMERFGLSGAMHPAGLFYNTTSIRQEIQRVFGGWPERLQEPLWRVGDGHIHPFKSYKRAFPTEEAVTEWSDGLDRQAEELFRSANVVVMTLGLIEAWHNPRTGNVYRQIPHPEVFPELRPEFSRLSVAQMLEDLSIIRTLIREHSSAEIIVTVSPVPLLATMTSSDVRVANCESKSRIRAAVSEFVEQHPDVHYFHSYEIVTTAERPTDFMREDGRHVQRRAVEYILQRFLDQFADPVALSLARPSVDASWIAAPAKTAPRLRRNPVYDRVRRAWLRVSRAMF